MGKVALGRAVVRRWVTCASVSALDFLFPRACMRCGKDDMWLCGACFSSCTIPSVLRCAGCGEVTPDGAWCPSCGKSRTTRGVWTVVPYHEPWIREGVHRAKYSGAEECLDAFAQYLVLFRIRWPMLFPAGTIIVPVPLHQKKERGRGYNQAHTLGASFLARCGGACGCVLLERHRATRQQAKESREMRAANVTGAFRALRIPAGVSRETRIVLLDDVSTTGATLEACAAALATAGFRDIWGFALAKG